MKRNYCSLIMDKINKCPSFFFCIVLMFSIGTGCGKKSLWTPLGNYSNGQIHVHLREDGSASVKKRIHLSLISGSGYWQDYNDCIVIDFPTDSTANTGVDIEQALASRFNECSVILEKKGKNCLLWRNEVILKKESDE